jgi:hypothetical protein
MIVIEGKIQDRIAVVYGRFQPLTKAHYAMMKKLVGEYQQVFIFPVQGPKAYVLKAKTAKGRESERARKITRSPLPVGIRQELIAKALPEVSDKNIMKLGSGSIVAAIDAIQRHHPRVDVTKVDVWCGPDEYDSYANQLKYLKEPHVDYDIKVKKFDVGTREEVSGTKLRKAIMDPDGFEEYKKLVAPPLADEATYNRLRKVMQQMKVPHLETTMHGLLNRIDEEIENG